VAREVVRRDAEPPPEAAPPERPRPPELVEDAFLRPPFAWVRFRVAIASPPVCSSRTPAAKRGDARTPPRTWGGAARGHP
jgi:hypothetical protein